MTSMDTPSLERGQTRSPDGDTWVRYLRTENIPDIRRRGVSLATQLLLGSELSRYTPDTFQDVASEMHRDVQKRAAQMLAEANCAALIDQLPLRDSCRVVAVGDSITADRLGWADLLFAMFRQTARLSTVTGINLGLGGSTTHDTIERFDVVSALKPDWILILVGTNDAREHPSLPGERLLSRSETWRNLGVIRQLADATSATTIAMTPPRAADTVVGSGLPFAWREDEIANTAAAIRESFAHVIDLHEVIAPDGCLEEDGLHPTCDCQDSIARAVLAYLATTAIRRPSPL